MIIKQIILRLLTGTKEPIKNARTKTIKRKDKINNSTLVITFVKSLIDSVLKLT